MENVIEGKSETNKGKISNNQLVKERQLSKFKNRKKNGYVISLMEGLMSK